MQQGRRRVLSAARSTKQPKTEQPTNTHMFLKNRLMNPFQKVFYFLYPDASKNHSYSIKKWFLKKKKRLENLSDSLIHELQNGHCVNRHENINFVVPVHHSIRPLVWPGALLMSSNILKGICFLQAVGWGSEVSLVSLSSYKSTVPFLQSLPSWPHLNLPPPKGSTFKYCHIGD